MPETPTSPPMDDLVNEVTRMINLALEQFNHLAPRQRNAAVMTTIMLLSEQVLKHSGDPDMAFLMLMSSMRDMYEEIRRSPDRRIQ